MLLLKAQIGSKFLIRQFASIKEIDNVKSSLWISCKRTEFNAKQTDLKIRKFGAIPLASNGWRHKKSKDDTFIIHARRSCSDYTDNSTSVPFENFKISTELINYLKTKEIIKATDIQSDAIEKILKGEHTLIAAETGSGKTYAYLLPILQKILERKQNSTRSFNTPLALILTPSRELAAQIGKVAKELCENLKIDVKVVTGGRTKQLMLNPTFEDVDVLVASMGAISKLTTTGIYRIHQVRHVVLDEADTLLDDSFTEKLEYFMQKFPVSFIVFIRSI